MGRKSSLKRIGLTAAGLLIIGTTLTFSVGVKGDGDRTEDVSQAVQSGCAENVILFIGDGMGDSEITIARNYHVGAAGRLNMDL